MRIFNPIEIGIHSEEENPESNMYCYFLPFGHIVKVIVFIFSMDE